MTKRAETMLGRKWLGLLALLGLSMIGAPCDGKDSEKCREGQEGVTASLKAGDQTLLKRWRDYSFKVCDDSEFTAIDREISEHQAAKQKAAAEKKKKERENKQVLDAFLMWAGSNKGAPDRAANATCEGDKAAEKAKERWCTGDRIAGIHRFEVTYWENEPVAAVFKTTIPHPIQCDALGTPSTVIRTWKVQGTISRYHCQISGGPAAGMQALITEAPNAPLEVFSTRFPELHAGMKRKLEAL